LLEKYKLYEAPEDEEPKLTPADEPKEEEPKLTPAEEPEKAEDETPEVKGEPKAETPEPAAAEEPATSGREVTPLETPNEAPATDDPEKVAEFTREQIKQDYPEEPYTSTALAFADSFVHDPQVYGRIRSLQWSGLYADSDTFLKQAKIVATFNNFTPEMAKLLVDKFGESAKYKLSRDGGVYAYITVRDTSKQHSLEAVKDLVNANVAKQTGNPGEVEIQWA
jgi:hypothetical protein